MRKQLRNLLNLLLSPSPSREKQGLIILISFFLALTLWVLATLNQEYRSTLNYPIQITEVPETLEIDVITPSEIQIEASGSGIELIGKHLGVRRDTIEFPFVTDFSELGHAETVAFQKEMQDKVGSDLKVVNYWPRRIDVHHRPKSRKSVPLRLKTKLLLRPAYQLVTEPRLSIDSIIVIGPVSALDTIHEWYTGPEQMRIISDDSSVVVRLLTPPNELQITPQVARLEVQTKLYTETQVTIPVAINHAPEDVNIRLNHQEILVTCLVPFEEYEEIMAKKESFRAEIPFDRLDSDFARIIPNVSLPPSVKLINQEPRELSFVILHL